MEIIKPDPDSQYRLIQCDCGGDNVAYVKIHHPDGDRWRVQCFDCGKTVETVQPAPRHDVQTTWNKRMHHPAVCGEEKAAPHFWDLDDDRETCGLLEEE